MPTKVRRVPIVPDATSSSQDRATEVAKLLSTCDTGYETIDKFLANLGEITSRELTSRIFIKCLAKVYRGGV